MDQVDLIKDFADDVEAVASTFLLADNYRKKSLDGENGAKEVSAW